jgi:alcohol dehydrogenase class IV
LENNLLTTSAITSFAREHFSHLMEPETMARAHTGIGNAPKIPQIFVPTTLSGAEYTRFAGCTNPEDHMKIQLTHPGMFPKLIILDPALTLTVPRRFWLSTGVRAIDHCVENICSSNARPESDAACKRGLVRMVRSLLAYEQNPEDPEARLESQLGVNDAMTGLTLRVWCGASHGIGHNLGPLGVGHGETSCILLPAVMKYNYRANSSQQETVKRTLWDDPVISATLSSQGCTRERSDRGEGSDPGDCLRAIFNALGMPRNLKQFDIGRDKWEQLAKNSLRDFFLGTNPVPITREEQVLEILGMVSGEEEGREE